MTIWPSSRRLVGSRCAWKRRETERAGSCSVLLPPLSAATAATAAMARNEEKAQAMLNRFVAAKSAANKEDKSQRPYLASECTDLNDCERYRKQILRDISKKVSLIQNEGLEEHKVRDLNDAINKLMREKGHWERQIKSLGGPDYFRTAPAALHGDDSEEVVPGKGYRYYGAAKKLPGVREMFAKPPPERQKRTRHEMMKNVDADYYGYRDDDDGVLEPLERAAEEERRKQMVAEWQVARDARLEADPDAGAAEEREHAEFDRAERAAAGGASSSGGGGEGGGAGGFVAHVAVPDQAAVKKAVLARRKQELLAKLSAGTVAAPEQPRVENLATLPRLPPSW